MSEDDIKGKTVTLDNTIIKLPRDFAEAVVKTTNYRDSNQIDLSKVTDDHFIGRVGEEAVKKVAEDLGRTVKGPDYTIYLKKKKSWDSDLTINGKSLAVKTQKTSNAVRFGLSWTFAFSSTRRDPILNDQNAWVSFVQCNDVDKSYDCIVYPPLQVKDLIFKEPIAPYLKGKKKVVYARDFPKKQ